MSINSCSIGEYFYFVYNWMLITEQVELACYQRSETFLKDKR